MPLRILENIPGATEPRDAERAGIRVETATVAVGRLITPAASMHRLGLQEGNCLPFLPSALKRDRRPRRGCDLPQSSVLRCGDRWGDCPNL